MKGASAPRVLITGAAHGVGRACALVLAGWGADLILCDHDGPALRRVSERLGAVARFCDVASETSVRILAHDLTASGTGLDVLINAAGPAYIRALGMWRMSRALFPAFVGGEGPRLIVNVASSRLDRGGAGNFRYASSREAFEKLSASLRDYARGSAVAVQTVHPGDGSGSEEQSTSRVLTLVSQVVLSIGTDREGRRRAG